MNGESGVVLRCPNQCGFHTTCYNLEIHDHTCPTCKIFIGKIFIGMGTGYQLKLSFMEDRDE
jgi:hypothetical protein